MQKNILIYGDKHVGRKTVQKLFDSKYCVEIARDETSVFSNLLYYDTLIYLLDDKIAFDKVFLRKVSEHLNQIKVYNATINCIICINKCDIAEYEIDNYDMSASLTGESKEKQNELEKYVCDNKNVYVRLLFGRTAYITQSLMNGVELSAKDTDFYGELEFGKNTWKKKSESDRLKFLGESKKELGNEEKMESNCFRAITDIIDGQNNNNNIIARKNFVKNKMEGIISLDDLCDYDLIAKIVLTYFEKKHEIAELYNNKMSGVLRDKYKITDLTMNNLDSYDMLLTDVEKQLSKWNMLFGIEKCSYAIELSNNICKMHLSNMLNNDTNIIENIEKFLVVTRKYNYKFQPQLIVDRLSSDKELGDGYANDSKKIINILKRFVADNLISNSRIISIVEALVINKVKCCQMKQVTDGLRYSYALLSYCDAYPIGFRTRLKIMLYNTIINMSLKHPDYIIDDVYDRLDDILYGEKYLYELYQMDDNNDDIPPITPNKMASIAVSL